MNRFKPKSITIYRGRRGFIMKRPIFDIPREMTFKEQVEALYLFIKSSEAQHMGCVIRCADDEQWLGLIMEELVRIHSNSAMAGNVYRAFKEQHHVRSRS